MSNVPPEDDSKDCVGSECYRTSVTPKRCSNCSPVIKVTWRSRDGAALGRGQRWCHRTPVRVINSASNSSGSSSSSSSGTSEHRCNVLSHAGTTPQWFLESPRVQELKESEGRSNLVLESDLKSMRLGITEFAQSHESASISVNPIVHDTPKKTNNTGSRTFNPFEKDLVDTMHLSLYSPSVFSKVVTPSKDELQEDGYNFSWGIDNIAVLYPSEFDDAPPEGSPVPKYDQDVEDRLQHAINTFFHTACVPSPWAENGKNLTASSPAGHPINTAGNNVSNLGLPSKTKRDVSCQTMLTLPSDFDLQRILENYYTFNENQSHNETCRSEDDADVKEVLSTSSLRRKLFANDEEKLTTPANDQTAAKEEMLTARTVSPMLHEPILLDNLPQTPFQDQCSSSPVGKITGRHQRASLTPPTIISPTVSPIRVVLREMEETDQGESDSDMSFMSTGHTQSMIECKDCLNISQSSNSIMYIHQNTDCNQCMGPKTREVPVRFLEPVDEDMEQWTETTSDIDAAPNFKVSFMETTADNSCCGIPENQFSTTENQDTGYQTNTNGLQITTSSSSDTAMSFSTSIQAPLQLWHKKAIMKCRARSLNPQNVTDLGKSEIMTNAPGLKDVPQTTLSSNNSETVWSPLVASTPSRTKLPIFN